MNTWQEDVQQFHEATGQTPGAFPAIRKPALRASLIAEEAVETISALGFNVSMAVMDEGLDTVVFCRSEQARPSLVEVIDGLCDLLYVAIGTAVEAGVDLSEPFREVHASNMLKLLGPKREDGKQLKPEGWCPPDIESILMSQARAAGQDGFSNVEVQE